MSFAAEEEDMVGEVVLNDEVDDIDIYDVPINRKRSKAWLKRLIYLLYILDWVTIFMVLALAEIITRMWAKPYHRYLPSNWQDAPEYNYPLRPARFPSWCLIWLFLFPTVTVLSCQVFYRSFLDVHHGVIGMLFSFVISEVFDELLKVLGGERRPNFKALCNPDPETGDCRDYTSFTDTTPDRSFPSGHTSIAFLTCLYTSLYLSAKMKMFNSHGVSACKAMIVVIPLVLASVVGITRTMDYFHSFVDVTAGALIGLCCGLFGYHVYYPPVWAKDSWKPRDRFESLMSKKKIRIDDIIKALIN